MLQSFQELKLNSALDRALQTMGFEKPTPIQAQAIPVILQGRDLVGCAQTGTGKTGAFCLPIAQRMLADPEIRALVLVPTRELALQIDLFWKKLTVNCKELSSTCIIGGASFSPQIKGLARKPRLVIATPGRLMDHLRSGSAKLAQVGYLVLDEADRMLDMGFAPQLAQIMKHVPKSRQTLLFTATWDSSLDKFASTYVNHPERVSVGASSKAASTISQEVISTTQGAKKEVLLDQLNRREGSVLVFARTQHRTDRLARYLNSFGMEVGRIHGGRSQGQRTAALAAFRAGDIRVLVATDIAARGIDVAEIAHVINFDLPQQAEDYVHRIGRTGRAGLSGQALSFLTPEDRTQWGEITRLLKKTGSKVPLAM